MSSSRNTSSAGVDSTYAPSDDVIHNGEAWCSVPTPDPWDPAILTLDGGGIRGYSSLLILQALMREISKWEQRLQKEDPRSKFSDNTKRERGRVTQIKSEDSAASPGSLSPERLDRGSSSPSAPVTTGKEAGEFDENKLLPCHYFDYMYGTSTGGLIATMLGRLRMSVPQCLEIYRSVGDDLFGRRRSILPLTTKYHHKPLEVAVREIVQSHCKQHVQDGECDGNDWHPWGDDVQNKAGVNFDAHICQSICLTAVHNGKIDEAHLLRTYNHQYIEIPNWITPYNPGADKLHIWQVTRATSAAPFYFKNLETELYGQMWTFKDGGIRENNPAGAAWSEFVSMYGEHKDPALLLSVGTGRPDETQDGFATAWPGPFAKSRLMKSMAEKFAVFRNVLIKYTDGEQKHKDMLGTAKGQHNWYKRLNVSAGLQSLPLDEWKKGPWTNPLDGTTKSIPGGATLTRMEEVTNDYLTRDIDMEFDTYAAPKVMLTQVAEKLVRQRRARLAFSQAPNADEAKKRWDTYMGKYLTGQYSGLVDGPISHSTKASKQ